jgi:hypothetical protein
LPQSPSRTTSYYPCGNRPRRKTKSNLNQPAGGSHLPPLSSSHPLPFRREPLTYSSFPRFSFFASRRVSWSISGLKKLHRPEKAFGSLRIPRLQWPTRQFLPPRQSESRTGKTSTGSSGDRATSWLTHPPRGNANTKDSEPGTSLPRRSANIGPASGRSRKTGSAAFALSRALPEARATADYQRRSAVVARHLKTRPAVVADKPNDF